MSDWRDFLDPVAAPGGYLAWKEVARRTSLSRTTAWRLQKRGDFPTPYAISPGRVGYREDEVEAWRVSRARRGSDAPADTQRGRPSRPDVTAAPEKVPPTTPPAATEVAPITTSRAPVAAARARPVSRRRSEHARAIAQQIRFDF